MNCIKIKVHDSTGIHDAGGILGMSYEKLLEPLTEMREGCEALLAGGFGKLTNDAREAVKQIYNGTGGLYTLFIDIIMNIGLENTAERAFLMEKFYALLRLVIQNSQGLLDEMDGPLSEEQTESMQFIHTTGEKLRQHVESIWFYSQLHLNQVQPHSKPVSLALVANSLHKPPVERAVKSTIFADEHLPVIKTDETLLRRALQELVNNAAKFSMDSMVIVHCRVVNQKPVVDVIDTGQGITTPTIARLFEPFFQADHTADGIGLGLTIASQIARLLRGRIEITDSRFGIGSTFSLFLPAA
jgi:signal transduction histidine kinase